jgi:glycosyltransferase involved in cell wall biosynthesis
MCAALNRLEGVEVELAATDADGPDGQLTAADTPDGVVTHLFHRTFSERWKYSAGLARWLRQHAARFDVVHIHALWSFASCAAAAAARRARVPYVVRPAGMLSAYTWSRGFGTKRLYWMLLERRTVLRAAAFHATSREEAVEIDKVCPGAQVAVIPNGVDEAAWNTPADAEALRRACGPKADGKPIVLFLSRLHPKKGITDLLLPALAQLGDAFLAIVGGPDPHEPAFPDQVRREIERLGLQDRAAMLGPVSGAARWQLYDGAAAFVLPSHSENFGIVVAEAMARGCPVVVTETVQAAEHVRAAGAGFVVPLQADAVASTLTRLLREGDVRATTATAGRRYAADHFRWDAIAAQILDLYRTCLNSSAGTGNKIAK